MAVRTILERDIIDPGFEGHYAFHSTLAERSDCHTHDFYEFFLVTQGRARHVVNGCEQLLDSGSLILIRPRDIHYYQSLAAGDCRYINVAFPVRVMDGLLRYLDGSVDSGALLNGPLPLHVHLTAADTRQLTARLTAVNLIPISRKDEKRAEIRTLLAELFTRYLRSESHELAGESPPWLSDLLREMERKENFREGLPALLRLSGRSQEHCCREMKRYLNKTPTVVVGEMRLEYAANLLMSTDLPVTDIALEAGYDSLSHFNHSFKRRFSVPPREFRRQRSRESIV